jgi:hypothetical protein
MARSPSHFLASDGITMNNVVDYLAAIEKKQSISFKLSKMMTQTTKMVANARLDVLCLGIKH